MVAEQNAPYIAVPDDPIALGSMLNELAEKSGLRSQIGKANRAKACAHFEVERMVQSYRAIYSDAMGREF
jgi:glycosyltransferase involved in cell wall biosynthesis